MQGLKCDPFKNWLDMVTVSHSGSEGTIRLYRAYFQQFLSFIGKKASDIVNEYEESRDRDFKRKYAQYLKAWLAVLQRRGLAPASIRGRLVAALSFFKYTDLPLGFIPVIKNRVTFHNRDITKEELSEILKISIPRDRAFFAVMAQSGLRPHTLRLLKIRNLQPDFGNGVVPCKIDVDQDVTKGKFKGHLTFIGAEALDYLKDYLNTRSNITDDSYVFTKIGTEKEASPKSFSHSFRKRARKLKQKGVIDFRQKKVGKPAEIRLYTLRKFFRKHAHEAGFEIVQYWMGHTVKEGVDESYRPRDPEFHRKLYAEKAAPFLRIDKPTPTETEGIMQKQAEEIEKLKDKVAGYEKLEEKYTQLLERIEALESLREQ